MPSKFELLIEAPRLQLVALGQEIKAHRKKLRVSALAVSKAAGISRVTLHRIESGEPTVAAGAYWAALYALGIRLEICTPAASKPEAMDADVPPQIQLLDYPALANLAWHVPGLDYLKPREAYDIYNRHERHLKIELLTDRELALIKALKARYEGEVGDV